MHKIQIGLWADGFNLHVDTIEYVDLHCFVPIHLAENNNMSSLMWMLMARKRLSQNKYKQFIAGVIFA